MRNPSVRHRQVRWPGLGALTAGIAYGAGLCCASVCLVASFRPAIVGRRLGRRPDAVPGPRRSRRPRQAITATICAATRPCAAAKIEFVPDTAAR